MRFVLKPALRVALAIVAVAIASGTAVGAGQKATFASEVAATQWSLADLDPQLPTDWTDFQFLDIEFRASSSQRFELALIGQEGTVTRLVHPFAGVWVRAAIPLRFYREPPGDAAHVPRNSYWMASSGGTSGALQHVRALGVTMRYPVSQAEIEIRKVTLSKTDPGDAVLEDGTPLIDDFGQYIHGDWPDKVRSLDALQREWQTEQRLLVAKAPPPCRFGGFARDKRRATGFFRVEKTGSRWWLIDPEGCRFWAAGVAGAGAQPPRTPIVGRDKLFASIPTAAQFQTGNADPDPLRDPVSFYAANLIKRYGRDWNTPSAQIASRRMRAWGFNTTSGAELGEAVASTPTLRQPYVLPLRGWQRIDGAVLGMPDVYADGFAQRVDADLARELAPRNADPWMIGFFIGDGPPWLNREGELVDRVLAGPASALQKRFRAELVKGDSPAARKSVVLAAFARYLDVVNAAVRRHDPHHLNLGIRFGSLPPDCVLARARGFDVLSIDGSGWSPPKDGIDRASAAIKLPILIAGFQFGVPERGMAAGRVQTLNQTERGVAYSYFVEHAAEHPAIVGTMWNRWVDDPASGRADGENFNAGLIDVTDRPYAELVAAAKASNARIDDLHSGTLTATTRKARASAFGTPDD